MATRQELRRRSSAADRAPTKPLADVATTSTFASAKNFPRPSPHEGRLAEKRSSQDLSSMPPPPTPQTDENGSTHHSRSTSAASRSANRLSLTLPVALPSKEPSRTTPPSSSSSVPPTPAHASSVASPSDSNDFIILIAAQERKVLELREELGRAEAELLTLKKRWTARDHLNGSAHGHEGLRSVPQSPAEDVLLSRRSIDLDRRKSILQQQQNTPTQRSRRVIRGGHTRTLSLLSPTKPTNGSSSGIETPDGQSIGLPRPPVERRAAQPSPQPSLSKRATWQPRSHRKATSSLGYPQIVEDFRSGLRAFVEDIRQITVGDEPISGASSRHAAMGRHSEGSASTGAIAGDREASKSSFLGRSREDGVLSSANAITATTTPTCKSKEATQGNKVKPGKAKHISWTQLGFESLGDDDWSSWESASPSPSKSMRWSGSTAQSSTLEDIQPVSEQAEEQATPMYDEIQSRAVVPGIADPVSRKAGSRNGETQKLSPKLEVILPNVVNRLSPHNIKRTASHLMDEWEKSLLPPEERNKENRG